MERVFNKHYFMAFLGSEVAWMTVNSVNASGAPKCDKQNLLWAPYRLCPFFIKSAWNDGNVLRGWEKKSNLGRMGWVIRFGLGFGRRFVIENSIQLKPNSIGIQKKRKSKIERKKIVIPQLKENSSSQLLSLSRSSLLSLIGSQLPPSYFVADVDSYSGDAVGPQRVHRLAFIRRGRNAG